MSDYREGTPVRVVRGHACGTSGKIRKLPKNYELVETYERGRSVLLMVPVENLYSEANHMTAEANHMTAEKKASP